VGRIGRRYDAFDGRMASGVGAARVKPCETRRYLRDESRAGRGATMGAGRQAGKPAGRQPEETSWTTEAMLATYPVMDTGVVVGILVAQLAWNLAAAPLLHRPSAPSKAAHIDTAQAVPA
jgi:hypothetical protein